jgi:nucleoside-diphosphate-sugar epimerase
VLIMTDKPRVLILGGLGFVGRHLVTYLVKNNLASKICVADKALIATSGLSAEEVKIYHSSVITYKQINLAREATIDALFEHDGGKWKYVINLAAATKYSQPEELYKENIIDVASTTAHAALKHKVVKYIHVSTAQVYEAGKKSSNEDSKLKPWTGVAKASLEAENKIKEVKGLPYVIVRPAIIYGTGDTLGLTPRLIIAATYKKKGKPMKFLWEKDLKINTVHVKDVARALWHLTEKGDSGTVWNLADQNDTSQGSIAEFLQQIFTIKTSFLGDFSSKVATGVSMKTVADVANDKHLQPWSALCKENGIGDTPLTPYLDEELLYNNSLSVDGSSITKLGFKYEYPKITVPLLKEVIDDYVLKGIFPKSVLN